MIRRGFQELCDEIENHGIERVFKPFWACRIIDNGRGVIMFERAEVFTQPLPPGVDLATVWATRNETSYFANGVMPGNTGAELSSAMRMVRNGMSGFREFSLLHDRTSVLVCYRPSKMRIYSTQGLPYEIRFDKQELPIVVAMLGGALTEIV